MLHGGDSGLRQTALAAINLHQSTPSTLSRQPPLPSITSILTAAGPVVRCTSGPHSRSLLTFSLPPSFQVPSDSILARRMGFQTSKPLVLVRPGDVEIYPEPPKSLPSAAALVADRLIAGPTVIYELKFDDGVEIEVVVSRNEDPGIDVRQRVFVRVPPICLMGATADEISFAM